MAIYAKVPDSKYVIAPEGLHAAVCCDVIDCGQQQTPFGPKHKVELRWQLADSVDSEKGPQRPVVRQRYTNSLHEKARLRTMLEMWRGRKFSKEELQGFDLEKLTGASCQVQIIHHTTDEGSTYANVNTVIPLGKGMDKVTSTYTREAQQQAQAEAGPDYDDDPLPF